MVSNTADNRGTTKIATLKRHMNVRHVTFVSSLVQCTGSVVAFGVYISSVMDQTFDERGVREIPSRCDKHSISLILGRNGTQKLADA